MNNDSTQFIVAITALVTSVAAAIGTIYAALSRRRQDILAERRTEKDSKHAEAEQDKMTVEAARTAQELLVESYEKKIALLSGGAATEARMTRLEQDVDGIRNKLVALEVKVDVFWTTVTGAVKNMLTAPTHKEKDNLIRRYPDLKESELRRLKEILDDEATRYSTADARLMACVLLRAGVSLLLAKEIKLESITSVK